jgi:energy-converting hydrogenase A subunit A
MIIHANVLLTISSYILAIASAMIVGLVLRLPILPEKPMRYSWTVSIIFPTSVLAVGFTAVLFKLGYNGLLVAVIVGVFTAIFAKYFLERVLPRPQMEESS